MKRLAPLVALLLLLGAGLAFYVRGSLESRPTGDVPVPEVSLQIERAIAAGQTDQAQQLLNGARDDLEPTERLYLEGLIAFDRENLGEATRRLEASLEQRPGDARTLDALVACYLAGGLLDAARARIELFLDTSPDHPRALWLRAVTYMRDPTTADPAAALAALIRIEQHVLSGAEPSAGVDPARYLDLRARTRSALGKHNEAVADAKAAVEASSRKYDAHLTHAVTLGAAAAAKGGDRELEQQAAEAAGRAAQEEPRRPRAWLLMAEVLLTDRTTDPDRLGAALHATDVLVRNWPQLPEARVLRARALGRTNEPETMAQANELWDGLARQFPDNLGVLRNYAVFLYDWKQGGQAGLNRDKAHRLLNRYVQLGGEIDEPLRSTWETLQREAGERSIDEPGSE